MAAFDGLDRLDWGGRRLRQLEEVREMGEVGVVDFLLLPLLQTGHSSLDCL